MRSNLYPLDLVTSDFDSKNVSSNVKAPVIISPLLAIGPRILMSEVLIVVLIVVYYRTILIAVLIVI